MINLAEVGANTNFYEAELINDEICELNMNDDELELLLEKHPNLMDIIK